MAGYFAGATDFGGGNVTSEADASAGVDGFLARFDSAGKYKWGKTFGTGGAVSPYGVAIDGTGNVAVGGMIAPPATLDFGCGALKSKGNEDIFLVEFDSSGVCQWSKRFGTSGKDQVLTAVRSDAAGNWFVAGDVIALDLGGGAVTGFLIAKFSSKGAHVWSKGLAAATNQQLPTLAVDATANVVLAGSFIGTADFGGGNLASAGNTDVFVAKYNSTGAYQWANQYGDSGGQQASGVAMDASGNILLTGTFNGSINFGAGPMTVPGTPDIFLAKLDQAGSGVWSKNFGAPGDYLFGGSIAVDGAGGPSITKAFSGSLDFGGGALSGANQPYTSLYVAKFDAGGSYMWAYSGGASSVLESGGGDIVANSSSVVLTGGYTNGQGTGGSLVLAGKSLPLVSSGDSFLASFTP